MYWTEEQIDRFLLAALHVLQLVVMLVIGFLLASWLSSILQIFIIALLIAVWGGIVVSRERFRK